MSKATQDQKANCPLTMVEQFHIDCNHQAKIYVTSTSKSSVAYANPDILEARRHLQIHGKHICCNFLPALHYKYLKVKLTWTQQDLNNVNWPSPHSELELFQPGDQRHIQLFINNKLPLHTSKAHPHKGSTLCPLYQCKNKDIWHFLECTHKDHAKIFNDL